MPALLAMVSSPLRSSRRVFVEILVETSTGEVFFLANELDWKLGIMPLAKIFILNS